MSTIERVIEVNVPVAEAYDQWNRFDEYPHFMEGITAVRVFDDGFMHWRATVSGKEEEWDAEIVDNIPEQLISWRSLDGPRNGSNVRFQPLSEARTLVSFAVDFKPRGLVDTMKQWSGSASGQVERDLERFKEFVESKHSSALSDTTAESEVTPVAAVELPEHEASLSPVIPVDALQGEALQTRPDKDEDVRPPIATSPQSTSSRPPEAGRQVQVQERQERRHSERRQSSVNVSGRSSLLSNAAQTASGEWRKLTEGVERMFTSLMRRPYFGASRWQKKLFMDRYTPPVEATESDGNLTIYADVPGMTVENLCVDINDDLLTLRGERHERSKILDTRSYWSERTYGRFTRTIRLPSYVDTKEAAAVLRDGVLEISLPTLSRPSGHRVEVRSKAA